MGRQGIICKGQIIPCRPTRFSFFGGGGVARLRRLSCVVRGPTYLLCVVPHISRTLFMKDSIGIFCFLGLVAALLFTRGLVFKVFDRRVHLL